MSAAILGPAISVIITSYNQASHLKEAIDSALAQTFPPYEIVVSDDCSRLDESVNLIQDYERRFPNLVREFSSSRHWNPAIQEQCPSMVKGDYVTILDGDDRVEPSGNILTYLATGRMGLLHSVVARTPPCPGSR